MNHFSRIRISHLAMALFVGCANSAMASDAVTDLLQEAYVPYRAALFKTNGASQPEALAAVQQSQTAWAKVQEKFGAKVPAPYDRDKGFAATLNEVARIYAKAHDEVRGGKLADAHNTLEDARDALAALRARNHVVVFSDHMNAYHAEMEHVLNHGVKLLDQPQGLQQFTAQAGVLQYLAKRLESEAPANLRESEEFKLLAAAVNQSVNALAAALFAQDVAAAKVAIGKIKQPYSKLFAKFG
jgi:hypothetical protein